MRSARLGRMGGLANRFRSLLADARQYRRRSQQKRFLPSHLLQDLGYKGRR